MSVSEKLRVVIAALLILVAIFYKKDNAPIVPVKPEAIKIVKPTDDIIQIVSSLKNQKITNLDSAKLSGAFSAFSEFTKSSKEIRNSIDLERFIAEVGKKTFGKEFLNSDGSSKYPGLNTELAVLIENTVGGQSANKLFSDDEKLKLSQLFNGIAWILYNKECDNEYDVYLAKAKQSISDYYNINPKPPTPSPNDKCPLGLCDGSGKIVQGDGHITDCPHTQTK